MDLQKPIINPVNPSNTNHILKKFEEYNKAHQDDILTFNQYLHLIIVYYNYIFKYIQLKEKQASQQELKEIHDIINKMEDYYLFGVFGNMEHNPLFNPESHHIFI